MQNDFPAILDKNQQLKNEDIQECFQDELHHRIQKLCLIDSDSIVCLKIRQSEIDDLLSQTNLMSKNNFVKNITKAFFRYLLNPKNIELLTDFVQNENIQPKKALKQAKNFQKLFTYNNRSLYKLIVHPKYGKAFEFFLTFEAQYWLQNSKNDQFYELEYLQKSEIHPQDQIDSYLLMEKFQNKIKTAKDIYQIIAICQYYAGAFRARSELDMTLEILSHQMEQIQLLQRQDLYDEYKVQQMNFYFIAGEFVEVKRIADKILNDFKQSLNDQLNISEIQAIINLGDQLFLSNQFESGVDMILIAIKHLQKMQDNPKAADHLANAYLLCSIGYFALKEYKVAAKYSELSYYSNKQVYESLFVAYVSYKKISAQDKAEEISQILKSKITEDDLNELEKTYSSHKNIFNYTNVEQKQIDQILKLEAQIEQEDLKSGRKIIWNLEKEVGSIENYIQNKKFEEGIQFFTSILGQYDPKLDFFRKLKLMTLISQFYIKQNQYGKAIEIFLDIHEQLLQKRNYITVGDFITQYNLSSIFACYAFNKDYHKAVQWYKRYHAFLLVNRFFTNFDFQRCLFMFQYIDCLVNLKMFDEALEYSIFFERYIDQFQNEKKYREIYISLINKRINLLKDTNNFEVLQKELEKYYEFLLPIKNQHSQQFYLCLFYLIEVSLQTYNNQGIIKYGLEYLKVRGQFEKEGDFLQFRCRIYFSLIQNYVNTKQYELASKLIDESNTYFVQSKDYFSLYHVHIYQINLNIILNKYECIQQNIQNAENLLSQYLVGHQNEQDMRALGYLNISSAYINLRDYQKSFEYLEKLVQLGLPQQFQEMQNILINNLLQIKEFKEKTENMILKYGLDNKSEK